jgi:hypothetical protein
MKSITLLLTALFAFQFALLNAQQTPSSFTWEQANEESQTILTDNADPLACPPSSIWSQPPTDPLGPWIAYTSDVFFPLTVYENFYGLPAPIISIHFWGLNASWDEFIGFTPCDTEDPMTFNIRFMQDNGGSPGSSIADIYTSTYRELTGGTYGSFPLYKYTITFSAPITLTDG